MDHLYIRHTVGGRLFLDSKKHETNFTVEPAGSREGWKLIIDVPDQTQAEDIIRHHDDLNIFFVPEGSENRKTWFFTTHGHVEYDEAAKQVIIWADGRIDYDV
ncbi:hypothetical protein [Paenibacillus sp. R14(2021)]|uniref:hypothetical protein n=1 Tax=Paenibacillus sp. R14(2021) TaxID=2859228 RepID=UPI001C61196B|nr:hypothetical protein [Paenibacillus sp. R14(2021)]